MQEKFCRLKEDNKDDAVIIEQRDPEIDDKTGSFIIHTILKAEEQ